MYWFIEIEKFIDINSAMNYILNEFAIQAVTADVESLNCCHIGEDVNTCTLNNYSHTHLILRRITRSRRLSSFRSVWASHDVAFLVVLYNRMEYKDPVRIYASVRLDSYFVVNQ